MSRAAGVADNPRGTGTALKLPAHPDPGQAQHRKCAFDHCSLSGRSVHSIYYPLPFGSLRTSSELQKPGGRLLIPSHRLQGEKQTPSEARPGLPGQNNQNNSAELLPHQAPGWSCKLQPGLGEQREQRAGQEAHAGSGEGSTKQAAPAAAGMLAREQGTEGAPPSPREGLAPRQLRSRELWRCLKGAPAKREEEQDTNVWLLLGRTEEQPVQSLGNCSRAQEGELGMLNAGFVSSLPVRKAAHTPANNRAMAIIDLLQSRGGSFERFWFAADTLNFGGGLVNFRAWKRRARKSDWSCLRELSNRT